jgi:uncharacterized small protein (DUF1192 family)
MFVTEKKLKRVLSELLGVEEDNDTKISGLKKEIQRLKDELADLKTTKKMEEREIEHLVKMKEEKNEIEYQKKEAELMKQYQNKEMELQNEYHKKVLTNIEKAHADLKDLYKEIMVRLPNVNVELKRGK